MRAEHVTKEFGGLVAVSDVSIDIPTRSIVSIIGPNGAGKTTLFNILTGLYKPSAGRIFLEDRGITGKRPDIITSLGVARTFQNIRLFRAMTALENVVVGRHARMNAGVWGSIVRPPGVRREERAARDRAREILDYVGLAQSRSTSSPPTCPMATSAAWRSPGPWRPIPRCCFSTSRPPA